MVLHFPSPLVQVVQAVRHSHLAELTQVTVNPLLFQVAVFHHGQRLAAAAAVMAILQVLQVDQAAVAVLQERVDLQVKVTLEALAYPTAQATG
jgi:hypothetical protein